MLMSAYIHVFSILCFLSLCICCTSRQAKEKVHIDINENYTCQDSLYFKDCRVVFLETTDKSLTSSISKVILADDRIFILDKNTDQIFMFSPAGKYITSLITPGRGPGECVNVMDFSYDNERKQLVVYADTPGKLLFFGSDGGFKKEMACKKIFYAIGTQTDGSIAGINGISEAPDHYISVLEYDTTGITDDRKFPMKQQRVCDIFAEGNLMLKSEAVYFTKRYDNTIYRLKNKAIEEVIQVDFGKYNFPEKLREQKMDEYEFTNDIVIRQQMVYSIVNIKEISGKLFFGTNRMGTFVVTPDNGQGNYWKYIINRELKLAHTHMITLEDPDNRTIGFVENISSLNQKLKYTEARSGAEWFKKKMENIPEGDNPVLFLYQSKC